MKKIKVAAVSLAVVFLAASAACAQGQGRSHPGWKERKGEIFKELNLSSEQKNKLEENRKAQGEESARLRSAIKGKYAQLQQELNKQSVTRAAVEPLVQELKSLDAQLVDNRINGIFAVKTILTAEQFAKFNQLMEKQRENRRGKDRWKDSREKPKAQTPEM